MKAKIFTKRAKSVQKFCAVLRAKYKICSFCAVFARFQMALRCFVLRKMRKNSAKQRILRKFAERGTSLLAADPAWLHSALNQLKLLQRRELLDIAHGWRPWDRFHYFY